MSDVIARAGIESAVQVFVDGNIEVEGLPYDFIINADTYRKNLPAFIRADAQAIQDHKKIHDWKIYSGSSDESLQNQYLLLLSLPVYEIEGKKMGRF